MGFCIFFAFNLITFQHVIQKTKTNWLYNCLNVSVMVFCHPICSQLRLNNKQYPPRNEETYPTKREVRNIIDSKMPTGRGYQKLPGGSGDYLKPPKGENPKNFPLPPSLTAWSLEGQKKHTKTKPPRTHPLFFSRKNPTTRSRPPSTWRSPWFGHRFSGRGPGVPGEVPCQAGWNIPIFK